MFIITVTTRTSAAEASPLTPFLFEDRALAAKWFEGSVERMVSRGWERSYSTDTPPGHVGVTLMKHDLKIVINGRLADAAALKEHYKDLPDWSIKLMLELSPS